MKQMEELIHIATMLEFDKLKVSDNTHTHNIVYSVSAPDFVHNASGDPFGVSVTGSGETGRVAGAQ